METDVPLTADQFLRLEAAKLAVHAAGYDCHDTMTSIYEFLTATPAEPPGKDPPPPEMQPWGIPPRDPTMIRDR